jgi:transposase-like protein
MSKYPATFKERVVKEYQPDVRGHGFAALAKRFKEGKTGPSPQLIQLWWTKWNAGGRTLAALELPSSTGRRSILTENEKQKHILKFVMHKNLIGEAVDYKEVRENVMAKTKKDISLTQVKAIGKNELDITWKQTTLVTPADGKFEAFLTLVL